jgi:hypothetical protein
MTQLYDEAKLRELILHVAWRSEDDRHFGAVKLNKILFFADFIAYRRWGRSITGAEYQKLEHGPAPRTIRPVLDNMERAGLVAEQPVERFGYVQKRVVALREPDLADFTAQEISLVDSVLMVCRGRNARAMSDMSHDFIGWRVAALGEAIPYGVAMIRKRQPTETERAHGLSLAEDAERALLAR